MDSQDIVTLSVGGTEYQTTLSTLTKNPESMLAAMFSGRHGLSKDAKGRHFIDRDGELFRFVLNFLRDSTLIVPSDNTVLLGELLKEAEYFQLHALAQQVKTMREEAALSFTYKEFLGLVNLSEQVQAPCIDLTGISIRHLDLSKSNLQEVKFTNCNLNKVNFTGANLTGACFTRSVVLHCVLNEAVLEQADCTEANFSGNEMRHAKCKGAVFYKARLGGIDMRGCDLQGANLQYANLLVANMEGANLAMANLEGANLDGANTKGVRGWVPPRSSNV